MGFRVPSEFESKPLRSSTGLRAGSLPRRFRSDARDAGFLRVSTGDTGAVWLWKAFRYELRRASISCSFGSSSPSASLSETKLWYEVVDFGIFRDSQH